VREVSTEDLLITDDSGPIGLAGVMGGETTELSETTTEILVEAANWHPASIFRTERRHKLPSEASRRFERGVDPELPAAAADRVVELLAELGGGTIEEGVTVVGGAPERRTVSAAADLSARITGMDISGQTAVAHLEAVGCEVVVDGDRLISPTRSTWSRRSPGSRATTGCRRCCRRRPPAAD
jgi:phenylalanyl-tRNA synthetase beta chain